MKINFILGTRPSTHKERIQSWEQYLKKLERGQKLRRIKRKMDRILAKFKICYFTFFIILSFDCWLDLFSLYIQYVQNIIYIYSPSTLIYININCNCCRFQRNSNIMYILYAFCFPNHDLIFIQIVFEETHSDNFNI